MEEDMRGRERTGEDGRGRERTEEGHPLRIAGIGDAPMTLEPDDAELAAMALLEMLSGTVADVPKEEPMAVTREYYSALADKIRHTRETERMVAARAVAYCEERLQRGSTSSLEEVLYKHRVTIEREGGELKRRWQHCLAAVTVRSMEGINL